MIYFYKVGKMKTKLPKGLIYIFIGLLSLILTLLVNRYIEINDIYIIILMVISLLIEIFGLIILIKDKKYY